MNNCRWVLRPYTIGHDAVYCEKPVQYRMVKDDDQNSVRKYNPFCPEHMQRHLELEKLEEETEDDSLT